MINYKVFSNMFKIIEIGFGSGWIRKFVLDLELLKKVVAESRINQSGFITLGIMYTTVFV